MHRSTHVTHNNQEGAPHAKSSNDSHWSDDNGDEAGHDKQDPCRDQIPSSQNLIVALSADVDPPDPNSQAEESQQLCRKAHTNNQISGAGAGVQTWNLNKNTQF